MAPPKSDLDGAPRAAQPAEAGTLGDQAAFEGLLQRGAEVRRRRRLWRMLPSAPRCKMCTRPFGPPFGAAMKLVGMGPWRGNPRYCTGCFRDLYRHRAGAEIECTLFFADVRGSTQLAESMSAGEFRTLLDRFYATAAEVLIDREAIVDKFSGDEVVGIFVPALTESHARQAVDAGLTLLRETGHGTDTPWIPIGIGINTGTAYVGAVGTAEHVEFTALGDAVNVTSRLASAAGMGEVLVSEATARAAQLEGSGREHRTLDLKGKSESTGVIVLSSR